MWAVAASVDFGFLCPAFGFGVGCGFVGSAFDEFGFLFASSALDGGADLVFFDVHGCPRIFGVRGFYTGGLWMVTGPCWGL